MQLQSNDGSVKLALIRELTRQRCHVEALAAVAALEAPLAQSRDALYLTVVNQRSLRLSSVALATLQRLQLQYPHFSRLYEERGYCFAALDDVPRAIDAFEHGITLNAALPSSWEMLERLYSNAGDLEKAAAAAEHLAMLRRLPAPIVEAAGLFSDGELAMAEDILRAYVRSAGSHAEALRLLGRIAHQRNVLDDAERLLEEALRLAPDYRAARADFARVLIDQLQYLRAREELAGLLQLDPHNPDYLALDATALAGTGEHDAAAQKYRAVLARTPGWSHVHLLLGNSLKASGRQSEAIETYRAAAVAPARFAAACWSLANLKTYRFSPHELERMRAAEAAPATPLADRCQLCFALGKAFEDRGVYAQSWHHYARGNALRHSQSSYDPQVMELNTRRQIEVCTEDFLAARVGSGVADPAPIFIVGLPRAGSTLIEQILASHSKVEGTQELHDIERIVRELRGAELDAGNPSYPAVLAGLAADDFRSLGERYLRNTRAYRQGKPFFIDKMPNNFRHIGLIHLMLPQAKIIDVRREPMACCFSNLKQLFAKGQEFTYGSEDIARYYRSYLELMRHWDTALPGRVLHIAYEGIVEDLEAGVRRLLQLCGLEFESECLDYYQTARNVSTASSEQVRQPIFRAGLAQWRHYEPWLGPLRDALGDALDRYRQ